MEPMEPRTCCLTCIPHPRLRHRRRCQIPSGRLILSALAHRRPAPDPRRQPILAVPPPARPAVPPAAGDPSEAQLLLFDPGEHAHQHKNRADQDRPQLHMQHKHVVGRLRRRAHRGQQQCQHHISRPAVVLPDLLRILLPTVDAGNPVLGQSHQGLEEKKDISHQAQNSMGRFEVGVSRRVLVVGNDGKTRNQRTNTNSIGSRVDPRSLTLLRRGMCWLKHQHGLGHEDDPRRVQQLRPVSNGFSNRHGFFAYRMRRKKRQAFAEDGSPYDAEKLIS
jgi:hypothetical protein